MKRLYRLILVSSLFFSLHLYAELPIPELQDRVMDSTNTLTIEQKNQLADKLKSLESEKGSQLAILIIPTTDGESIEQFSLRVVEKWKLGRKKINDGILILVAKNDRKMRIEVGYGLEGALPDAICKRIISEQMRPNFKAGKFYEGIDSATESVIKAINGEALPTPVSESKTDPHSLRDTLSEIALIGFLVVIFGSSFTSGFSYNGFGQWMVSGIFALIGAIIEMGLLASRNFSIGLLLIIGLISFILILLIIIWWINRSGRSSSWGSSSSSWSSSSSDSSWSSSSSDSFSGGGGDFGGGGASGDW